MAARFILYVDWRMVVVDGINILRHVKGRGNCPEGNVGVNMSGENVRILVTVLAPEIAILHAVAAIKLPASMTF